MRHALHAPCREEDFLEQDLVEIRHMLEAMATKYNQEPTEDSDRVH